MRKANRVTTMLAAVLCVPAIGLAAADSFAGADSGGPTPNKGHQPFVISGNVSGTLAPGSPSNPISLTLRNPNNQPIAVASLTVTVTGTSAGPACGTSNFGVAQYQGAYPLMIDAGQTVSLTQLGVAIADLPHVRLIDLPSNQDACERVTVYLSYTGTGEGR